MMMKFFFKCLLIYSLLSHSVKSSERVFNLLSSINDQDTTRIQESATALSLEMEEWIYEDIYLYREKRNHLLADLYKGIGDESYFWLKTLESSVKRSYLDKVIELISQVDLKLASSYVFTYQRQTQLGDINFFDRLYSPARESRGEYWANKKSITIDILPIPEFIPVFIHELAHFEDPELHDARLRIKALRSPIAHISSVNDLSDEERNNFGRYWFLRSSYLNHYKEIVPRRDACIIYTEMIKQGVLLEESERDSKRYEKVFSGELTCEELTRKELKILGKPKPFWSEGKPQAALVEAYTRKWHEQHGLEYPFFRD